MFEGLGELLNEKQLQLVLVIQDMINGTLELYEKDPAYAPPSWILENWWNTLEALKRA
jgi:hypothetical protein